MTLDLTLVTFLSNVNLLFKFKFLQSLISQILDNKGDDDIDDINEGGGDVDQADEEDEDEQGWGGM